MSKRVMRGLSLHRETVRELSEGGLATAGGGWASIEAAAGGGDTCQVVFGAVSAAAQGHCISNDIRLTCGCFT